MKCLECQFKATSETFDELRLICLVDGQVYAFEHPCHMEDLEKKITMAMICKMAKPFQRSADMVRAALQLMYDRGLDADSALAITRILMGRYMN